MDSTLEALLNRTGTDTYGSHPLIFRLPADHEKLLNVLTKTPGIEVHDRIQAQLRELIKSINPSQRLTEELIQEKIAIHLNDKALNDYGSWVLYPWSKRLVHLLDEAEFAIVRTDRNRNKITREEQLRLSKLKVGVVGLSVGQSVSMTMALERSFGEIRLADFDTLDLSNLNRIRTGTHHLGMNKVLITAREIAELDPYLKVICFNDGLTKENMDAFFTEGGNLDILVEECDSVDIKILARQKAKAMRIPVVMDMSDRGCLDVERFDLEPDRPLMHGWIDHLDLDAAARPMTAEEKVPYMLPITGMETLSPRMKASVIELGQSLSTWPQLATSVVLGGALAGDAVRRIALDEFRGSGRWFVDLEELVSDPAQPAQALPKSPAFRLSEKDLAHIADNLGPAPTGSDLDEHTVEQLVEAGGLAPSAGNMQPWKFLWQDRRLLLFHDIGRSSSFWDPEHLIAHIALGTCVENIVLKAHELGLEIKTRIFPADTVPLLTASFELSNGSLEHAEPHVADQLASMIGVRSTNRKVVKPSPLAEDVLARLAAMTATVPGCDAHFLEDP
ncbi:MAG: Rv1355c family protein, partial [Flavobacteriales bacterium]